MKRKVGDGNILFDNLELSGLYHIAVFITQLIDIDTSVEVFKIDIDSGRSIF